MAASFFDALDAQDRQSVRAMARRRRFRRGETIFHEGDPGDAIHVVEKGSVAIRVSTPLGDVATLAVLVPGDAFGEGALLEPDARRTASAVPLEPTETRALLHSDFRTLCDESPRARDLLVDALAAQVRRLSQHLVEALYTDADTRLARRLLDLADRYPAGTAGGSIPITQEDLASMAGTTRPTANRFLQAASADGVVALARGRIVVVDHAGLVRRAR